MNLKKITNKEIIHCKTKNIANKKIKMEHWIWYITHNNNKIIQMNNNLKDTKNLIKWWTQTIRQEVKQHLIIIKILNALIKSVRDNKILIKFKMFPKPQKIMSKNLYLII